MFGKALLATLLATSLNAFGLESVRCTLSPSSGNPVDFSISRTGVIRLETNYGIAVVTAGERHVDPCAAGVLCFDIGMGLAKSFKDAKKLETAFVPTTIQDQIDSSVKFVSSYAHTTMSFETVGQSRLLHLAESGSWGAIRELSLSCHKP